MPKSEYREKCTGGGIIRLIVNYLMRMLPYILFTLPKLLTLRIGKYLQRRRKGLPTNYVHELGLVFFLLFLTGLASLTVIPKVSLSAGKIQVIGAESPRVNLVPLNKLLEIAEIVIAQGNYPYLLIEVLGNVGMFAVIGFMLPLLWRRFQSARLSIATCLLTSLFIEVAQLLQPRATDIDDLILNTLGGALGYLLYRLLERIAPRITGAFKY